MTSPAAPVIAVWDQGDVVYVATLPRGPIVVLEGTAAVIWRAADPTDLDGTVSRVAEESGLGIEEVRPAVQAFLGRLVEQGLMRAG